LRGIWLSENRIVVGSRKEELVIHHNIPRFASDVKLEAINTGVIVRLDWNKL
jgi:hypothetical protein